MQDVTIKRLIHLSEQFLQIIRSDETIDQEKIMTIHASKGGYMSFDDCFRCKDSADWLLVKGMEPIEIAHSYRCFDCKHCGSEDGKGICLCKLPGDNIDTTFDSPACKDFEDSFYE